MALIAAVAAIALAAGCGGEQDSTTTATPSLESPEAAAAALSESTLCDVATDGFLERSFGGPGGDPDAQCRRESRGTAGFGVDRVRAVETEGERATARVVDTEGDPATLRLVRAPDGRWLIDEISFGGS